MQGRDVSKSWGHSVSAAVIAERIDDRQRAGTGGRPTGPVAAARGRAADSRDKRLNPRLLPCEAWASMSE
ncbi:hypothetical protein MACH15_29770 [Maricaulis maris]|nr:hypothetical protein MACH15_29770 [Maricaulis maris]